MGACRERNQDTEQAWLGSHPPASQPASQPPGAPVLRVGVLQCFSVTKPVPTVAQDSNTRSAGFPLRTYRHWDDVTRPCGQPVTAPVGQHWSPLWGGGSPYDPARLCSAWEHPGCPLGFPFVSPHITFTTFLIPGLGVGGSPSKQFSVTLAQCPPGSLNSDSHDLSDLTRLLSLPMPIPSPG